MDSNPAKIEDALLADIPTAVKIQPSGLSKVFTSPFASMVVSAVLMFFLFVVSFFIAYQTINKQKPPENYDECTKTRGSIIRESYPAVCVTKDNKEFIQPLSPEEQKLLEVNPIN